MADSVARPWVRLLTLENQMQATASGAESFGGISAQAHGRESTFHRISAQMFPVFLRKIKIAQASVEISERASGRFGIALLPYASQIMGQAFGGHGSLLKIARRCISNAASVKLPRLHFRKIAKSANWKLSLCNHPAKHGH